MGDWGLVTKLRGGGTGWGSGCGHHQISPEVLTAARSVRSIPRAVLPLYKLPSKFGRTWRATRTSVRDRQCSAGFTKTRAILTFMSPAWAAWEWLRSTASLDWSTDTLTKPLTVSCSGACAWETPLAEFGKAVADLEGGRGGLRPLLSSGIGIFLGNVLEWYTNLPIPDDETVTKTLHLQNLYLHFQRFEGLRCQKFPVGAFPRTPEFAKAYTYYKPPTSERTLRSLCKPRNLNLSSVRVRCGAELTVLPER